MKKWASIGLAAIMLFSFMTGVSNAEAKPATFVRVVLDGQKIWFPDAQAFVDENERTLVPVRFVAEKMNAKVGWEPATQTVPIEKGEQNIRLTVGESKAVVNGQEVTFDTKAVFSGERTFVPLRFVSEVLGAEVKWDGPTSTVFISTKDQEAVKVDQWGRLIRTTDLPKNAADYPYILADVPNEMYEMRYPHSHPDVNERSTSAKMYADWPEFKKENIDIWMERLKTFGALWLNVDYRTIDNSWAEQLASVESDGNTGKLKAAKEYVAWVKENEIVIEGYLDPEPSMIYLDGLRGYNIRSKFRIKFNHFKEHKTILYDSWFPSDMKLANDTWVPNDTPFEKGVWYEGYSDIVMSTNVGGNWGKTLKVSANASLFFNIIIRGAE
ncbi:copper amine oxidase N-terminal domain-containing protein [Paenibacillus sp. S150]|uniref:copper amine oxidase N-terminal domain-containing protein n=1 Tax=Paenibacillus sp. S150 TaxID=2749826 RepID=UPI001C57FA51|nr:copper amine oxidase N-terminal domain-containing protein [Paenibacillus sp. S150]MBW4081312.1 copper amine oxidase N-terminal domain-containing protein [Paenibacillus sp. S150]